MISRLSLPREQLAPTNGTRFLKTIVTAGLLLWLANLSFTAYLREYPINEAHWLLGAKWELLHQQTERVDWLIVGDSTCNQGVDALWLQQHWKVSVLNLCTVGDLILLDDYLQLQTHLDQLGPPGNLLVIHTYDVWERRVTPEALGKTPLPWGFWQEHLTARLTGDQLWQLFLSRHVPLVADNLSLQQLIIVESRRNHLFQHRFQLEASGYYPYRNEAADMERAMQVASEEIEKIGGKVFQLSPDNAALLEKMSELAEQRGFQLYLANGPINPMLADAPEFGTYASGRDRFLQDWVDGRPNVHFLDFDHRVPLEWMINEDHVVHSGALIYTQRLAEALERSE